MLTLLKTYLPHILVAVALVSVVSAAYASVVISTSSQLHVKWNPNPVTITISPTTGTGSATVQLTCNQPANDLVLTPKGGDNSGVKLTVTPSNIPLCSSVPVTVTLTATCQAKSGSNEKKNDENKCNGEQGEVDEEVEVTQPYNYYGREDIPDRLKVKIKIGEQKPDFQLVSNPASITCNAGQTVTTTITVTPTNGFTGTTKLSTAVLPTGITADISPKNIAGAGTSTLTVNCSTPGQYSVEVRGVTNYAAHGITIPVTVNGVVLPSFTITGEESSLTCLAGGTAHDDIAANAKNGFTGPITLSTVTTPATGLTATISPVSLTGSGTASLTVQCTTPGMYNIVVKGVSGDLSSTFTIPVAVTSPNTGDFAITTDSVTVSVAPDNIGTAKITVSGTGMFTGPIALTAKVPTGLDCQLTVLTLTISTAGSDTSTSLKCSSQTAAMYTATVTGSAAGKTHKVDVKFNVQSTSLAANNPTMFGFDPLLFYGVIGALVAAGAGSGAFLLRRRSLPRPN